MNLVLEADRRHEEVTARLPGLTPKLAAIQLLEYLKTLPSVASRPELLFYHADALQRLCSLVVGPFPFSTHPGLLSDLMAVLGAAGDSNVARRVGSLADAKSRLGLLLCAECGIRGEWGNALEAARGVGISLPVVPGSDAVGRADELLGILRTHPSAGGLLWPYHFLEPRDLPADPVLGVLVDGEDIPVPYREAYLCTVGAELRLKRHREAPEPVVRARDDRGEDLPLSDELKDLVREAVARSFVLLGPVAQRKLHQLRVEIDVAIRRPTIVTQLAGRSILLPLILSLSRTLAQSLNLAGVPMPRSSVVWSGDVDEHGNVRHVDRIEEKVARVLASRADGFACPAEDDESVRRVAVAAAGARRIDWFPVAHVQDCMGNPALVAIRSRGPATRAAQAFRRKTKPLGLAGTGVAAAALVAIGFAVPRLASWLDTSVSGARFNEDRDHVELVNSRDRTLRRIPIEPTGNTKPILADLDRDGQPEVLYGTSSQDPTPGTLFCVDAGGQELWRFKGGFTEGVTPPYEVTNSFVCVGALTSDLDGDGSAEVVGAFRHDRWFPSQLALLSRDGRHLSSFWNPGHLSAGTFTPELVAFAARDIDGDGYVEILVGGTNNRCNRATLTILDPRSFGGMAPECNEGAMGSTWQSYVLFPGCPEIEQAAAIPRLYTASMAFAGQGGEGILKAGVHGEIPGKSPAQSGYFRYVLDTNLNVVDFYWPDGFASWIQKVRAEAKLDVDITSPEFSERMRQIEVLRGPPELLRP